MKQLLPFVALSALLILPGYAQGGFLPPPPPLTPGTKAPAFATRTLGGKALSLGSLRGKVVLVDYWATWCGPCRMATPMLESLHKKYARRGLRVVGMSMDDPSSVRQVPAFAKHFGMTYALTIGPANFQAAAKYHANGIPAQYLIDKKGVVRWSQSGYSQSEDTYLNALIPRLLAEKS